MTGYHNSLTNGSSLDCLNLIVQSINTSQSHNQQQHTTAGATTSSHSQTPQNGANGGGGGGGAKCDIPRD